jgi:hypothetical protein
LALFAVKWWDKVFPMGEGFDKLKEWLFFVEVKLYKIRFDGLI